MLGGMSLSWMQRRMRIEMTLDDIHEDLNLFRNTKRQEIQQKPGYYGECQATWLCSDITSAPGFNLSR
jgi:hypothetical protein